jgi:hypothetical protein
MSNITVVQQNKCVGKLKEIYVIIHEDAEGNQGVFAERCFYPDGTPKVAPELSPYAKDLPGMEKYVEELNRKFGKELGQTLKIKKFFAPENFN